MGATRKTERECCNYCMWLGPVNQDGTMRKHRPAREGTVSGERKIQDFTKPHCAGSNKPYARFGCDSEETTTVNDQQPTTAQAAADLPKGARVTNPEGRTGSVNGYDVGRVAIQGHASYGREYVGVEWDAVDGDMGLNRRSRPFVDELTIVAPPESPRVGERVTYKVGRRTVSATVTRRTNENEAGKVDVVNDGDQTGRVRYVVPALLTVQAPDIDKLHEAALYEDQLRTVLAQSLAESESAPRFVVRQNGNAGQGGYFIVHDRTTHRWVRTTSSRSGAQHIADCLNDGTMVLNSLGKAVAAQKPVVETSSDTNEYGVFEDGECIETGFHGGYGRVAAGAAAKVREDDPANDGLTYEVKVLCPEHDEQAKDTCEECAAEGCGAVDADDLDACGECSDCTG